MGYSVNSIADLSGDGISEILVGAPGGGGLLGYAALVNGRDGNRIFEHWGLNPDDWFGGVVIGIGDATGDGLSDYLISAPFANILGNAEAGEVHLFSGVDGTFQYNLRGSGAGQKYGKKLARLGDVDSDGHADFLISSGSGLFGTVHVVSGKFGQELYRLSSFYLGDHFGASIAGLGDVDGDGVPDFIVGAPDHPDIWGSRIGAAYVFSGDSGELLHFWEGYSYQTDFGHSVAGPGDINGDQVPDIAVGSPDLWRIGQEDPVGGVFLYSGVDFSLIRIIDGYEVNSNFGWSCSWVGDFEGDGRDELLIGAQSERYQGISVGGAYVISFDPYCTPSATTLSASLGGTITFQHDFPESEAGVEYAFLASSGLEEYMINYKGVDIPLANTLLLRETMQAPPRFFHNARGQLDQDGRASTTIDFPPGVLNGWIDKTFAFACVTFDPPGQPRLSSARMVVKILP